MPALTPYQQLEQEFRRLDALRGAAGLLRWDAAVMMPHDSADGRADQLAALDAECHAILISPRVSRLLERAAANSHGLEDWQHANLREMRRQRDRAIQLPANLISRLARATARAEILWSDARRAQDFALLAPTLAEVVTLVRDKSHLLGAALGVEPYDALVDEFSPGLKQDEIESLFRGLTARLPGLIHRAIDEQGPPPPALAGRFPLSRQRQFASELMRTLGFRFERGRLDESEHPFTGGAPGDTRVTARFDPSDPLNGILVVLHEAGHALYDQGLPAAWRGQPVGRDRGMAVHESQSLLFEMVLGRSLPFATWLGPKLERAFGTSGADFAPEALHARMTYVARGPIRVDADELTYNVHVMLRYDLEQRLLSGELRVTDLPEAWQAELEGRLGVSPANAAEGCLQDVHWAAGAFGYFPCYTVGAMLAGQLYETLRGSLPGLDEDLAHGRFGPVVEWLRTEIHESGSSLPLGELVERATGRPLSALPWLRYVEGKYLPG